MILPIYAYGHPVLKKKCRDIDSEFEGLEDLIQSMWDTMYGAKGVGLAAPQIGKAIRLFLVDTSQVYDEEDADKGIKKVFINAQILSEKGEEWTYEEGCLSIPQITGEVDRLSVVKIRYHDENFVEHTEVYDGMNARVIQHEYDHIEGVLFTDHLKPIKRRLLKRKLEALRKGKFNPTYRMKFVKTQR